MNEERTAVISLALEGRLGFPDAARLLAAITDLEIGQTVAVEPPCRPPSWREGAEDIGAMLGGHEGTAVPALAHRLAGALRQGSMGRLTPCLAALDVVYLSGFSMRDSGAGVTFGGQYLQERDGRLRRRWVNIVFGGDPLCVWLFSLPLPIMRADPASPLSGSLNGQDVSISTQPDGCSVATPAGVFHGCLQVRYELRLAANDGISHEAPSVRADSPQEDQGDRREDALITEIRSVWLAPGVGPVRVECQALKGATRIIELAAFGPPPDIDGETAATGSFFPRQPGRWWHFESRNGAPDHREIWRALAPDAGGNVWMSVAAVIAG